jgi:hypothetical protein
LLDRNSFKFFGAFFGTVDNYTFHNLITTLKYYLMPDNRGY